MSDYHRKLVSIDRLKEIIDGIRRQAPDGQRGRTVVQCHGCFDIVHPGHVRYLEFARSQGDILVVSITGDAGIDKGALRPYIPQELRAENLAALEFVDYVVIDPNPTARELLETLRPDVYVKGHEYATSSDPRFLAEREVVESYGGRIIFSSGQVVFSSSRLVESMAASDELASHRLAAVCRRHDLNRGSLARLLSGFRGRRVVVLGDLLVERYVLCDAMNVASESPMMSLRELAQTDYPGGAAIVAAQLAALGAEAVLITGTGADPISAWAVEQLTDAGVRVSPVPHRRETAVRTRYLVDDHKLFKVDRASICPLDSVSERRAADLVVSQAADADAAIVYDWGYGLITPGLLQLLGATFRHRIPFIAGGSAGPQVNLAGFRCFDLVCCSERRLRLALNDFGGSLSTLAYEMLQETQAKQMLVTLGKRGVVAFDRPSHDRESPAWVDRLRSEFLPSFARRVADRLGGGEAVMAMAALSLACGAGLMQGAYLGSALAALQIAAPGAGPVCMKDLRRWLGERPELGAGDADGAPAFRAADCRLECVAGPLKTENRVLTTDH